MVLAVSREAVRTPIIAAIEARKATWSAYPLEIEYDNRLIVNTQTQTNPFLQVRFLFLDGSTVELGSGGNVRIYGQLQIAAAVREGGGWLLADRLLDYFTPVLHTRQLGIARMYAAVPAKDKPHLGWLYSPVLIPFEADTLP